MTGTKLGLHVTSGPRGGYGDVVAAAPAVVLAVNEGGCLLEAREKSVAAPGAAPRTITIFRTTEVFGDAPPGIDDASEEDARLAAGYYWPALRAKWAQNPSDFLQVTNELGGDNRKTLANLVAFETRLMELAEADGLHLAIGSPAGGSPGDFSLWVEFFVPLIRRAFEGGHVYSRHAYGGVVEGSSGFLTSPDGSPADDNAGRPFVEAAYLLQQGIRTPMVITEAGQHAGYKFPGAEALILDVDRYDALCRQYENIWAFCAWTYGDYQGYPANIQDASSRMRDYLVAQGGAVRPEYPSGDSGEDMTLEEQIWAHSIVEQTERGFHSAPTALQDAARALEPQGYRYVTRETYAAGLPPYIVVEDRSGEGKPRRVLYWTGSQVKSITDPAAAWHAPVGTLEERNGGKIWPGAWYDANPYGTRYQIKPPDGAYSRHTGADLNLPGDADKGTPVYAMGAGTVTYARLVGAPSTWGRLVVVRHAAPDGKTYHSRYGHLATMNVQEGQQVLRGDVLGTIGGAAYGLANHLHFDVSHSGILQTSPTYWPGDNLLAVQQHFLDPKAFLEGKASAPVEPAPPPATGNAQLGLHAGADSGELSAAEFALFALTRPGVVKVLSSHGGPSVERLARDHPAAPFIVRAFLHFGGRNVTPAQFVEWTVLDVQRALAAIGPGREVWVELHNEPNLVAEGLGASWANGAGFAPWMLDVLARYKLALPAGVKYLFPGLSPGGDVAGVRQDTWAFLEGARPAVNACDGLGVHAYWHPEAGFPMGASALSVVDEAIKRFPGKPIWVTEASSKTPDGAQQGAQYVTFWQELRKRPAVRGVTYFVASGSHPDFQPEVWLVNGQSRGIAEVVGSR